MFRLDLVFFFVFSGAGRRDGGGRRGFGGRTYGGEGGRLA